MFYENNLIFENAYGKSNYDMEYLPSIFSGKIIDKEQLI